MKLLEVKNAKVYYKTRDGFIKAVDGVSFDIEKGETLGLIGESGCGKTTVAKSILRLLPTNAKVVDGEIYYEGRNILSMKPKELREIRWKKMSMIPQSALNALNPVHKVGDQVLEAIKAHENIDKNKGMERVKELFELVGLSVDRVNDYPHQFSGGMRQRAIIAMALALNPSLIIADEPTTALDVIVQYQILQKLNELQKRLDISIMVITHDISVIAQMCDKIAVMYAGKIVERADAEGIFKKTYHPYTLGLQNCFSSIEGPIRDLISIPGYPPNLINPASHCRFYERCPFTREVCKEKEPEMIEVEKEHYAACHRVDHVDEIRELVKRRSAWEKIETLTRLKLEI